MPSLSCGNMRGGGAWNNTFCPFGPYEVLSKLTSRGIEVYEHNTYAGGKPDGGQRTLVLWKDIGNLQSLTATSSPGHASNSTLSFPIDRYPESDNVEMPPCLSRARDILGEHWNLYPEFVRRQTRKRWS